MGRGFERNTVGADRQLRDISATSGVLTVIHIVQSRPCAERGDVIYCFSSENTRSRVAR